MPIYEYECKACGYIFDEMQNFKDKPIKKCPQCKKNKVQRLISLSAFHLQGSGWYETDYGKKKVSAGTPPPAKGKVADSSGTVTSGTPDGDTAAATADSIKKDTAKAKGSKK